MEIRINKKFRPLFQLLQNNHPEVDTVIMTGGRGSTKSFNVALFSQIGVVEHEYKVLYSRFTNQSIGDSIKAEVSDKIELLGYEDRLIDTNFRLESNEHDGLIAFKGIKTGSKTQTANLKSLSGFNVFIVDEAEEIPDLDTFTKVYLSIRSSDKRNISILILNPTTKENWIWKEYFEKKIIDSGFNGIVDNVMYIHSSYLDAPKGAIPKNIIDYYERMKVDEPERYENIVLGGWMDEPEGVLFPSKHLKRYDGSKFDIKNPDIDATTGAIDTADTGSDHLCMVIGYNIGEKVFIQDVVFTLEASDNSPEICAQVINLHSPEHVRVESNFGGSMYKNLLADLVSDYVELSGAKARSNKHSRITVMSGIIKKYCHFRNDYEKGSDYDLFMRKLTSYLKEDENEHDDAPDGISLLMHYIVKTICPHLYETDRKEISDKHYSEDKK